MFGDDIYRSRWTIVGYVSVLDNFSAFGADEAMVELVRYTFIDVDRLTAYFDQLPKRRFRISNIGLGFTSAQVGFGPADTANKHSQIQQLEEYLAKSNMLADETTSKRRSVDRRRIAEERQFRVDEFLATRALLPCKKAESFLTIWLDNDAETADPVWLYLLADYPRNGSAGLQHLSAFSFLWLIMTEMGAGFTPAAAGEAEARAAQDKLAALSQALASPGESFDKAFARYAKPKDLLLELGAIILPSIRVRVLYEVRYAWRENYHDCEAIFGYPIYVSEPTDA